MSLRPIIDAGPALNFLAINKERVLIDDDGGGATIATAEKRRLDRLRAQGKTVGSIALVNTLTILRRAAGRQYLPDKAAMQEIYNRLREYDDGLLPIKQTNLLDPNLWK